MKTELTDGFAQLQMGGRLMALLCRRPTAKVKQSELPVDYEPLPPVTIAPYNQIKAPATSKKRAHGEIDGDDDFMTEDEQDDDDDTLVV